jgi:polynucleotide 5'-kinase involved in rRNA processing
MPEWLTNLNPVFTVVGVSGIVGLVKVLAEFYDRFKRSRLLKSLDLSPPPVPESHTIYSELAGAEHLIEGRQEKIKQLRAEVERKQLVFVHGPSGVGKSTLLKVGLSRELYSSRRWLPIFVDSWGEDWVLGPWNSLASEVQLATSRG